jgi:putative peptidoglycan lipid II flippase
VSIQKFIAKNSLLVMTIFGISAVLGLIRESSIAYMFGASKTTDAYLVAMIIPSLISGIIGGSITSVFVTVYVSYLAKNAKEQAIRTANIIISLFILLFGGLAIGALLFTPAIVHLVAPSYRGLLLKTTIDLTRVLIPNILFGGLVGVFVGINNSHHSFLAPSAIGLISNIFILTSIFTLGKIWGIYGLAVGAVFGIFAQFTLQLPSIRHCGFRYRFILDFRDPGMREIMILLLPFIFSAAAGQVNLIVSKTLATGLSSGMVSALNFADKLASLPSLFVGAMGAVVFPLLVNAATLKDWPRLVEGINRAVRLLTIVLFPAAMGIYVLRVPLIKMLFEHGAFHAKSTFITANIVPYFLCAMFFGAMVSIFVNIYFALKKMIIAVGTGIIAVGVNIGFSLLLIGSMKQYGLALANSLATLANLILLFTGLFVILRLHEKAALPYRQFLLFIGQAGISVILMGGVVWFLYEILQGCFQGIQKTFGVPVIVIGIGGIVYLVFGYILRIEEICKGVHWISEKARSILRT